MQYLAPIIEIGALHTFEYLMRVVRQSFCARPDGASVEKYFILKSHGRNYVLEDAPSSASPARLARPRHEMTRFVPEFFECQGARQVGVASPTAGSRHG